MTETTPRDDSTDRETDASTGDRPTMKDVDHTPPAGAADANRVFERGGEHRAATTDGGPASGAVERRESDGGPEQDADRPPEDDEDGEHVEA